MASTVTLGQKDLAKIQQQYVLNSLIAKRLNTNIEFVGARTVRIYTVGTVPINDYDRTASANRYGTPQEVGDSVQELTMMKDRSFTGIIDKGNSRDQVINKAGKFLKTQVSEAVIPEMDAYAFQRLAKLGGTIVGTSTAITAANVIARLSAGRAKLLNMRVPVTGRTLYVSTVMFNALVDTDQFKNLDKLGSKAIINGQIGEIYGSPVVELPEDLIAAGVNFLWVHKDAASAPRKLDETNIHVNPPGISGNLVEGRNYYDTFVIGAKAGGVYVDVTTGSGVSVLAAPTIAPATGVISPASGATAQFTVDGTDPRFSASAVVGTAPTVTPGTVVKAYVWRNDTESATYYHSPVTAVTVTG